MTDQHDLVEHLVHSVAHGWSETLWSARNRIIEETTQTGDDDPRRAVGSFLTAICEIIETGYVLVPQYFDDGDDGDFDEGEDIAPGLTAAFTTEWEGSNQ
jgi:hypothetical protein